MAREPVPGKVLDAVELDGFRYELADAGRFEAVFVSCLDPRGPVRWRRLLQAPDLVVLAGTLRFEAGSLVVVAAGEHCRGATDFSCRFTLTPAGELKKQEPKP